MRVIKAAIDLRTVPTVSTELPKEKQPLFGEDHKVSWHSPAEEYTDHLSQTRIYNKAKLQVQTERDLTKATKPPATLFFNS